MEHDAVFLMECADEAAKVLAEHAPEWNLLGRHDVHVKVPRPQRCRDLESDEACPDHDGARLACFAASAIARLSVSERRECTCDWPSPASLSRTGSAPVAT